MRAAPRVLAATVLGSSLAFIDGTAVNVGLPALQADLGTTAAGVQWVVEGYALTLAALPLIGGVSGDRHGRRIYAAGVARFAPASLLCGLSPGVNRLIAARAIQRVSGALLVPRSLALLGASFIGAARNGRSGHGLAIPRSPQRPGRRWVAGW